MAQTKRTGICEAHLYLPEKLYEKVKKLAQANRRTINGEIIFALEDRLEQFNGKKDPKKRRAA